MPSPINWVNSTTVQMHRFDLDLNAGLRRIHSLASNFSDGELARIKALARETGLDQRPLVVLGAGELGLTAALPLIKAQAVKGVVAFFHEPKAMFRGYFPRARSENALALKLFGEQCGVPVTVDDADLLIVQGEENQVPDYAIEAIRAAGSNPLVFNAVAFARYKGPSTADIPPPEPQISIDGEGRFNLMKVPPYDQEGVAQTLAWMGYNDGALRQAFFDAGLLGAGAALVWDLPAFLSGALGAIAGGFRYYFAARKVLEDRGQFDSTSQLVARGLIDTLGGGWVRKSPLQANWIFPTWPGGSRHTLTGFVPGIYYGGALGAAKGIAEQAVVDWNRQHAPGATSFVQLDMAERYWSDAIAANDAELRRRVAALSGEVKFPLSLEVSRQLLMEPTPVVPRDYHEILSVFRAPASQGNE